MDTGHQGKFPTRVRGQFLEGSLNITHRQQEPPLLLQNSLRCHLCWPLGALKVDVFQAAALGCVHVNRYANGIKWMSPGGLPS